MLGFIFEKTTALVSSTVDVVIATGEAIIDDVTSIPESIEKGWTDGLLSTEEQIEASTDTVDEKSTSKFAKAS